MPSLCFHRSAGRSDPERHPAPSASAGSIPARPTLRSPQCSTGGYCSCSSGGQPARGWGAQGWRCSRSSGSAPVVSTMKSCAASPRRSESREASRSAWELRCRATRWSSVRSPVAAGTPAGSTQGLSFVFEQSDESCRLLGVEQRRALQHRTSAARPGHERTR